MKTDIALPVRAFLAFAVAGVLSACVLGMTATSAFALSTGQTFTKGGNVYKVTKAYQDASEWGEVTLVKYGSTNKKPVVNAVKYKGESFEIEVIGKNAFNNKKGHKITYVRIGEHVDKIGAKAFYGCKKLRTINLAQCDAIELSKSKKTGAYYVDQLDIGKNAFKKAGVSQVKVKCGSNKCSYKRLFKKSLMKKGLRSNAHVVK